MTLYEYNDVTSTMDVANSLNVSTGFVLAKSQTMGRGRRGRHWESLPGNFFGTLIAPLPASFKKAGQLSFCAIIALSRALVVLGVPNLQYKWPNDLLSPDGAKLGGILLEAYEDRILIGIGVNLVHAPNDTPYPAASLQEVLGVKPSFTPKDLALQFGIEFEAVRGLWQEQGMEAIGPLWLSQAKGVGEMITVTLSQGVQHQGTFKGLDTDGALLLEYGDGRVKAFHSGEVFWG